MENFDEIIRKEENERIDRMLSGLYDLAEEEHKKAELELNRTFKKLIVVTAMASIYFGYLAFKRCK